jgi:tetratricopeptide (TPR) repeat protein
VQHGRTKDARARVERRLSVEPKRVQLLLLAGRVFVADGDLVEAERVLRRALDLAPAAPESYMLLADIYRTQQRLDRARADLDAEVQRNAANIGARSLAAVLVHAGGNVAEAKRRYADVLGHDPRIVVAANNLAWLYADEKQNLDEALDLAQRATEQIPDYAEAWDTLGWVYIRKQLPLLAIAPFEKAVGRDPANATFHYHLGMALAGAGDEDKSRESLQTALKLQPDFPEAQRELKGLDQ